MFSGVLKKDLKPDYYSKQRTKLRKKWIRANPIRLVPILLMASEKKQ